MLAIGCSMDTSRITLLVWFIRHLEHLEIYQPLVKMSWNDNQPGLEQAIWYLRTKARRASPLLARSGLSLSGNLWLTNICYRMWMQQVVSLVSTTFVLSHLSEADTAFYCREWVNRWWATMRWLHWPLPKWIRPSQNSSLAVFDCHFKLYTEKSCWLTSSNNRLCDGLFEGRKPFYDLNNNTNIWTWANAP